ncbi:MAG: hypothetical protein ABI548_11880 [Polyangiaceae bacterium]
MPQTPKPPNAVDTLLAQLRETLKEELRAEVRQELIAELGGKPAPKPNKLTKITDALLKTATAFERAATGSLAVSKGEKRSPAQIEAAVETLYKWLKAHPGSRIETAAGALGVETKDLTLLVAKLKEAKRVTVKGKLRGTTYTARG